MARYTVGDFVSQTVQKDKGEGLFEIENDHTLEINLNGMVWAKLGSMVAYRGGIKFDIKLMRRMTSMMAGGLFNIKLEGTGMVAITTYYDPLTLMVTPDSPVSTNPNSTVAWSGSLYPELKTDITFKTLVGRGSGETFQMEFKGNGFVVVQPYEEVYYQMAQGQTH